MTISANNHKDLLTTKEAASLLGFKKNTREIWRTKGKKLHNLLKWDQIPSHVSAIYVQP